VINLETTSEEYCITEINDRFFHTNHYVSDGLKEIKQTCSESSLDRYEQGTRLTLGAIRKSSRNALNILSDKKIFSFYPRRIKVCTLCTALFEISDEVVLRVYAPKEGKDEFMEFSSSDLPNWQTEMPPRWR
jgi:hypothetical protein